MFKMNKKIKGSKNLNVPNKGEQSQTCLGSAERKEHLHKENVPNLRFPEFSGEWGKTKFENIVSLQRGSSPRPIIEYITKSEDGVNWVKIGDMPASGRIVTRTEEKITREGAKKSRHVKIGDLILSNSMSFGQPYIMGIEGYIHDGWFVLRNYEKSLVRDYLCNLLISPSIQQQYKRLAAGGVVQNISSELVNSVIVSVPTKTEQKKIAEFISYIDDRIATQIKIIEKLESLIKGIAETHYSQCECTKQVRISELGEAFTTMNMSKEDLSEEGNECVLYGELFTTYGCVIKDVKSRTHISTDKATTSQSNDLLFPASTTVDAMSLIAPSAICKEGVILGGDLFGVHVNKNYNNEYLSYLINYIYKSKLARYAQGSTIIHLHYSDIKNATLLLPTIEEQNYLAHLMRGVEEKINIEKDMLSKLYSQKAYLLSNLFI